MIRLIIFGLLVNVSFALSIPRRMIFNASDLMPILGDYEYESPEEEKTTNETMNCSSSYTGEKGEIFSPNHPNGYPDNIFCKWDITVPANMSVLLIIDDLNLRLYDKIYVYDGPPKEQRFVERYSKYNTNYNFISTKNQISLHFYSKEHYYLSQTQAFKLTYKAIKHGCGQQYNGTEGIILSPGYPDPYERNLKCSWTIETNPSNNILIIFDEFDLGPGYDTLALGYYTTFRGDSLPKNFMPETNSIQVKFKSWISNNGQRFKLRYKVKSWDTSLKFLIFASEAIIHAESSEVKTIAINGHRFSKMTAYDIRKETLVWFEPESHQVHIKFADNSTRTIPVNGVPNSLALDYINDLIYWIDIRTKTIKVMDINDTTNKNNYLLLELKNENPRDLIINAKKTVLVWSDIGFEPKIMTSKMDGTGQNILYSNSRQATHLTIDYQKERYYFVDINDHSLYSIDFEGNNETFYIKSVHAVDINTMIVLNNDLFVATDHMIYRLPELDLRIESIQVVYKTYQYTEDIVTYMSRAIDIQRQRINSFELVDLQLQPLMTRSECTSHCQYLCLSSGQSFRCLSPHIRPNSSNTTINPVSQPLDSSAIHPYPDQTTNKLSIFNTFLIILVIIFNAVAGYFLYRSLYKTKLYQKCSSETRLPLEGIDSEISTLDHSKRKVSRENLIDCELDSNF